VGGEITLAFGAEETEERMTALITVAAPGEGHRFERFAALGNPSLDVFLEAAEGTGMEVIGPPLAVSHPS
jgi:hypothetical protein